MELARDLMDGRVGALFHVRAFRSHPRGAAIGELGRWGDVARALGLAPLRDVARVFVTAYRASDLESINVMELSVPDDVVRAAFVRLGGNASGIHFALERGPAVFVALVAPGRLVSVPSRLSREAWSLGDTAPLPAPEGRESARFFAFEPAMVLGGPPAWPMTLLTAQAEIELVRGGSATVRFEATSSSSARAAEDARFLSEEATRLLSVDLGLFSLDLLDPPRFESRGNRVVMQTDLLPTDVDWLLAFTGGGP